MEHEIRMVLGLAFVLVGDGQVVTLFLWIENHHRDVQPPEHHARDHGVLAPLQRREHGRTRHPRGRGLR
jgi:hypothetical protein